MHTTLERQRRRVPIDVEWQDERGRTLARYDGPFVTYRLVDAAPKHSVCLRFIDPYGDAVFNQRQIEALVAELDRMHGDAGQMEVAESLRAFLEQTRGHVDTYVWFLGD